MVNTRHWPFTCVLDTQMTHELAELERHRRIVRDCQDSLALALARLEAYSCRERVLTRENQALRAALLHAGVRIDQVVRPQQEAVEDIGGPHIREASAELSDGSAPMADSASFDTLYILPISGGHPIYFNAPKERVWRLASTCLPVLRAVKVCCRAGSHPCCIMLAAGSREPACHRRGLGICRDPSSHHRGELPWHTGCRHSARSAPVESLGVHHAHA